ncbi:aspartyl/asparaginyl beta-hydroxylase domain-containing protein [Flavobacterium sp.]|uniref:aspartyl/asparaginyl beta-hydroxylase domain-containing protein n=1 Tax=Flavobacterium sp. TaxID=239 RepID=UPI003C4B3195
MNKQQQIRSIKFPLLFNSEKLKREVTQLLSNQWRSHYNTSDYRGNWSVIALLSKNGRSDEINALSALSDTLMETEILELCPYIQEVLRFFECKKTAVRLLNLGAGAEIKPHRDNDLGYEDGSFRLHIPIITNPEVEFILDNQRLIMKEGECWYIDANFTHSVVNRGTSDRIHLVIDGVRNEWTDTLFFKEASLEQFLSPKPVLDLATKEKMIAELRRMDSAVAQKIIRSLLNDESEI